VKGASSVRASAERERILRRLQAQRRTIGAQLLGHEDPQGDYPRSLTMRALTRHPGAFARAAWELFGLWRAGRSRAARD
jgi:hypothetical protein